VLIIVCEKLMSMNEDEKPTLAFIHDYLEARLTLLKTIQVSCPNNLLYL
jgi:neurofibromin 1